MDLTNLRFRPSTGSSSSSRRVRAAVHKARELRAVEERLQVASKWATRRGDAKRAAAYARQAAAAHRERLRWAQLARHQVPSTSPAAHIAAAFLCALAPLIDAFMSSATSSPSWGRVIGFPNVTMLIATIVTLVIVGLVFGLNGRCAKLNRDEGVHGECTLSRNTHPPCEVPRVPQHWASTIAQNELSRKLKSNPDLEFVLRHNL